MFRLKPWGITHLQYQKEWDVQREFKGFLSVTIYAATPRIAPDEEISSSDIFLILLHVHFPFHHGMFSTRKDKQQWFFHCESCFFRKDDTICLIWEFCQIADVLAGKLYSP